MKNWLVAALLLPLCAAAPAQERIVRYSAYAYDFHTDQYLYTETHEIRYADGKWLASTNAYYAPDGKQFGRKTVDFSVDPFVPAYQLDLTQEGYKEGITRNGDTIVMTRQSRPDRSAETEAVKKEGLVAADAGLLRLLVAHLDVLMKGETLNFRVAAASRLDTYKFRAKRAGDTTFEGKPAVRIQVDMDSVLKLFAGPLTFTLDAATHRLLEFRGVTNVRDPTTGNDYHVRLAFYSTPPKDAPRLPPLP